VGLGSLVIACSSSSYILLHILFHSSFLTLGGLTQAVVFSFPEPARKRPAGGESARFRDRRGRAPPDCLPVRRLAFFGSSAAVPRTTFLSRRPSVPIEVMELPESARVGGRERASPAPLTGPVTGRVWWVKFSRGWNGWRKCFLYPRTGRLASPPYCRATCSCFFINRAILSSSHVPLFLISPYFSPFFPYLARSSSHVAVSPPSLPVSFRCFSSAWLASVSVSSPYSFSLDGIGPASRALQTHESLLLVSDAGASGRQGVACYSPAPVWTPPLGGRHKRL